jgi:hypothetical protein
MRIREKADLETVIVFFLVFTLVKKKARNAAGPVS